VKLLCHRLFGFLLLLHGLFKLPSEDAFDGDGLDFFPDSFLFEKAVEGRTAVFPSPCDFFLTFISFLLDAWSCFRLAKSKSSSGVFRVFLMNPCSKTIRPFLSI